MVPQSCEAKSRGPPNSGFLPSLSVLCEGLVSVSVLLTTRKRGLGTYGQKLPVRAFSNRKSVVAYFKRPLSAVWKNFALLGHFCAIWGPIWRGRGYFEETREHLWCQWGNSAIFALILEQKAQFGPLRRLRSYDFAGARSPRIFSQANLARPSQAPPSLGPWNAECISLSPSLSLSLSISLCAPLVRACYFCLYVALFSHSCCCMFFFVTHFLAYPRLDDR